ncbi:hypothetical protein Desor_4163 [Desulfosporosinus orientis DSM 765]|uniref:Uncharacterized protein n=1 Tax=Desulfosporosinus orientis (strain ATCC 19365 / DSM 765 / NCIMB 8382 / VKM B-1628 / Singapore I) TaxID=768706 RepID=G7WHN7_DESOD|nr:DUF6773 family protein [Desulfosporosinus orientis]AET69599.1 hypothetical protein Desor_4163 [Desulfosporosinus orientis DSM 765]
MKDERIQQALNKIRSEMVIIILFGVALSFLVKTLVFDMTLQECITEYLIMIFCPIYQLIRMHMMKMSIYSEKGNKQSLKNMIIVLVIFLIMFALAVIKKMKESAVYDWQNSIIFVVLFIILFTAIFIITNKFNRHRGHVYEKEFDDD